MRKTSFAAAFTLIELLVVMAIIAVLATLVLTQGPALLARAQMTATLNNERQLFLAAFQMATDGTANTDPSLGWPADITTPVTVTTLTAYCDKLVANNYMNVADLRKVLSAPGVNASVTGGTTDSSGAYSPITAISSPALKIYYVKEGQPSNTLFAATANYTYNTALTPSGNPYGDKGFVVLRKGGDASRFSKSQATGTDINFQNNVGRLPGDADGKLGTESSSGTGQNVLVSK